MIVRAVLNGVELSLAEIFASLTIRHARGSIDDSPLASTATLTLVDVTRELVQAFSSGDELELAIAGSTLLGASGSGLWAENRCEITEAGDVVHVRHSSGEPWQHFGAIRMPAHWSDFPGQFPAYGAPALEAGHEYEYSFEVLFGAGEGGFVYIDYYTDEDGEEWLDGHHNPFVGTGDWQTISATFTVPAGTVSNDFGLYCDTDGFEAEFTFRAARLDEVGDPRAGNGSPRFRGRVSDATVTDGALSLIAVSSLSWLSRRRIGTGDWPAESWSDRVRRVFGEAGILLTWSEESEPWSAAGLRTWAEPDDEPRLTLEVGGSDPMMAARTGAWITLGSYLERLLASEPATVANLPDGSVLVQAFASRADKRTVELDPDLVAYAPEWVQVDEIENELSLTWAGGSVSADSPASVSRFESRPRQVDTELDDQGDAEALAIARVVRRAFPRWVAEPVELLELEPAIGVGSPVGLHELPAWAPDAGYLAIVEGWEDQIEPADEPDTLSWTMKLLLSDPRLSGGFGVQWAHVPAETAWNEAAPATWTDPSTLTD